MCSGYFLRTLLLTVPMWLSALLFGIVHANQWHTHPALSILAGLLFLVTGWVFDLVGVKIAKKGLFPFEDTADPAISIAICLYVLTWCAAALTLLLSLLSGLLLITNSITLWLWDNNIASWVFK